MFEFDAKRSQIIFTVAWIAIFSSILIFGWSTTWAALVVPTVFPEFADMRTVQGALYSLNEGFDPQINNVGDPWGRSMNYPSIWISISEIFNLKIELHFKIFVSLMVLLFLGCCFLMLKQYPSLTLLLLCFSGATLLAVERGNNDILIFSLLYFSVFLGGGFYVLALLMATLLKIFPILAFPAFCRSFKTFFLMFAVAAIALILLFPEFSNIRNGTPVSALLSYGSPSISAAFQKKLNFNFPAHYISILVLFTALVAWRLEFLSKRLTFSEIDSRAKQMFLIGAYVYVGTFILSSNWDYRLIFLILCVPYVMNANDRYLRILMSLSLIIAFNQQPLHFVLGPIGVGINILSKILLAVFCTLVILIDLRTRVFMIFKWNV
tara:strand:- start:98 stop:1234 length:1137 start_codon:yes stop_codon:yes gene_type:complete